jgi:hypothetical protein
MTLSEYGPFFCWKRERCGLGKPCYQVLVGIFSRSRGGIEGYSGRPVEVQADDC